MVRTIDPSRRNRPGSRRSSATSRFSLLLLLVLACFTASTPAGLAAGHVPRAPALFQSPDDPDARGAQFLQQVLTAPSRSNQAGSPGSSSPVSNFASENICKPTGKIEDASCDYETVESINSQFFECVDDLRKTDFFRFYKIDLFKECPYWTENGLCMNRACSVETAEEFEIPEEFRTRRLSSVTTVQPSELDGMGSGSSCSCSSTEFCHLDDENSSDAVYVDLLKNPERFTGYAGASANRVWKSIYEENCFGGVKFVEPARPVSSGGSGFIDRSLLGSSSALGGTAGLQGLMASLQAPTDSGENEQCLEKRVFYRIISGLHASISIHICHEFLDQKTGEWSPNLECFITRIAEHPERLQNVYFDYVLLMRALSRLGDSQAGFSLHPNHRIEDPETIRQLDRVIHQARERPSTFDEAQMFSGKTRDSLELKQQFRQHFRNISSIMDCVGCDKCRLWGKLQVNGIGTALKLLFNGNDAGEQKPVLLQRSELVSLVNAAHRIAESLRAVETFREMYQQQRTAALQQEAAGAPSPAKDSTLEGKSAAPKGDLDVTSLSPSHPSSSAAAPPQRDHKIRSVASSSTATQRRQSGPSSPAGKGKVTRKEATAATAAPEREWSTFEKLREQTQRAAHWLLQRFEKGVEECRRSLGHCLEGLGFRVRDASHTGKADGGWTKSEL